MAEGESSLVRRPDLLPEQLLKGGLIVGADNVHGSLMSMAGMALERITRERSETPPELQLPERPVYLLDPSSRRMIMVTNREHVPGPDYRRGLFAEIVELDEEGKPKFRLSTQHVILPNDQYQPVAVGPNEFRLPPSYIEMVEEDEPDKPKFVPWNVYLGSLQTWMNELTIAEDDTFGSFMNRFITLKELSTQEATAKIRAAFPGGPQGFDQTVAPYSLIISDDTNKETYIRASRAAGLYPVFISCHDFVLIEQDLKESRDREKFGDEFRYSISHFLPADWGDKERRYRPATITHDWTAMWRTEQAEPELLPHVNSISATQKLALDKIMDHNPIFNYVYLAVDQEGKVEKDSNGSYYCPNDEQIYREFLYKVKADLMLTMFVRGGAPIIK